MRVFRAVALLAGIGLFVLVLSKADVGEAWASMQRLGVWGLVAVLSIKAVASVSDAASRVLTLHSASLTGLWLRRVWPVQVYGEALNSVTPLAPLGGEPVKAALLRDRYEIGYRELAASFAAAQTLNALAVIVLALSCAPILAWTPALPAGFREAGMAATVSFAALILIFYLVQRHRVVSRLGSRVSWLVQSARAQRLLNGIRGVEDTLVAFYATHRPRFVAAAAFSVAALGFGALEIFIVLEILDHPVSFAEAWLLQSTVVLVRSAAFFLPASLGAQEATFLIVCGALTGSPATGLAMALIRRARELSWILLGLALGWGFSFSASELARVGRPVRRSDPKEPLET